MNTTEKGNLFEDRVFKILSDLIQSNKLPFKKEEVKIYQKKRYYSKDREKDIVFDIAIEIFLPNSAKPFSYIIIECKDEGRKIPVDYMEELLSKRDQVAYANSKCILISTSELQDGAYKFACNKGIAAVRIFEDDLLQWIIERTNKEFSTTDENSKLLSTVQALTNEYFVTNYQSFFAIDEDKPYGSFEELLSAIMVNK